VVCRVSWVAEGRLEKYGKIERASGTAGSNSEIVAREEFELPRQCSPSSSIAPEFCIQHYY
jgi:hypothetical protein